MISVILNVYKRPYMLERQIQAIKSQSISIKSENIHVWYNKSDHLQLFPEDKDIKTYTCNYNTKFCGRFTLPLLIRTPYIAMFDDDMLPKKDWFKNCMDTIEKSETNGILGGSGVILNTKAYSPYYKVGWNGEHVDIPMRCDLVGHSWFYRQDWIKYMWYENPYTWDNGEDITFSYLAQKYGNINTFVPPHPYGNIDIWSCDPDVGNTVGTDENASWRVNNHLDIRNNICANYIDRGWKTVNNIR
jgi:hypothetical protein